MILVTAVSFSACVSKPEPKVNMLTDELGEIRVEAPNCPDWTGGVSPEGSALMRNFETQHSHSNYSCATMTNYGKMIDDPMDMISGKSTDYYDGQTAAQAVSTSRTQAAQ